MTKQDDILKESKREFVKEFANHPNSPDHHGKLFNDRWDVDEVWNFIETQIKKALQAREREIVEEIRRQLKLAIVKDIELPNGNTRLLEISNETFDLLKDPSNKTKEACAVCKPERDKAIYVDDVRNPRCPECGRDILSNKTKKKDKGGED